MILLEGVSKRFGNVLGLDNVCLRVEKGKTSVLLGTSGCGKSTILRLILGLIKPDSGEVSFDGQPVAAQTVMNVRHRTGYVLQQGGLFPHMTAWSNITLMAEQLGWDKDRIASRVKALSELAKIPDNLLKRFPNELSGGQCQRVGIMRALMLDPEVLLLDEPLGALDPITRGDLQRELKDIFNSLQKTVLLVTHDIAEAEFLGDKVCLMHQGQIVQEGTLDSMRHAPAHPFVRRFIEAQTLIAARDSQ